MKRITLLLCLVVMVITGTTVSATPYYGFTGEEIHSFWTSSNVLLLGMGWERSWNTTQWNDTASVGWNNFVVVLSPVNSSEDCHGEFRIVVNSTFTVSGDITLDGITIDSVSVDMITYYSEYYTEGVSAWSVNGTFTISAQSARARQSNEHVLLIGVSLGSVLHNPLLIGFVCVFVVLAIVVVALWVIRRRHQYEVR